MMTRKRLAVAVAVASACVACPGLLIGCEGQKQEIATVPETQPAPRPPAPAPLPPRALVPFDRLEPAIDKPVNPPSTDVLPARARQDVQAAEKLLGEKNYAAAVDRLERAAGFAPAHPRIRRLLGQAYLRLPNRGKAIANLGQAVKVAPDDLETQMLLGQLAASQQQNDKAIVRLRTALACSQARPENARAAEALLTVSLLLDRQGYWRAAEQGYARLAEWIAGHGRLYTSRPALKEWVLRPDRLLARRGSALLLLRKYDRAAELLERAHRRDRTNTATARRLIDALLAAERYDRAEQALLGMAAQPSQQANLRGRLVDLCSASRDRALPQRFWKAFQARHAPDANLAIALAKTAQDRGWADEALAILQSVVSIKPNDADLWRTLCRSYARRRDPERLFATMEQTLRAQVGALASIAEGIGELAAARTQHIEQRFGDWATRSRSPVRHALLYLAGRLAGARGRHGLAGDLLRLAIEQKKDFFRGYEALLDAYLEQKRTDDADRLLDQVDRLAKDTHLPPYLRGKAAFRRGDHAGAVRALLKARTRSKGHLPTRLLLAEVYVADRKPDEAVRVLEEVLQTHPDHTKAARRLFDLHLARGQFAKARSVAAKRLQGDRDDMTGRLMIAELAMAAGRRADALALLAELARRAPENADVQYQYVRGLLGPRPGLIAKGDFDDAAERLRRILRVQPGSRPAQKALAELLDAVGRPAEAAGVWAGLADATPRDASIARRLVDALTRAGQDAAAARAVERARKDNAEDLWLRLRQLELLGKTKRFDEAMRLGEEWIGAAVRENNESVEALFRQELLRVTDAGKQYDKALKVVAAWIAHKPAASRLTRLKYNRIRLLGLLRRYDEAAGLADRLAEGDPLTDAGRYLAMVAAEAKDYDQALQVLGRWTEAGRRFADEIGALKKAVEGLARKKVKTDAAYEAALAKAPEDLRGPVADAVGAGRHDRAQALLDLRQKGAEAHVETLRTLQIIVCGESKQLGRARHLAEEWIKQSPQVAPPRRALVALLADADAYDEAEQLVTKWLKQLAPATAPAPAGQVSETVRWLMETSIRLRISREKPDEALKLAERHLRIEPKNAELLALKSAALGELKRDDEALATMEAALALKPDDAGLNNNLGYMYAERGVQLRKAEAMLRKAISRTSDPTSMMAYTDSLGWVLYKQRRLREAGRIFQGVLRGKDDEEIRHGVILDHAGDVYYRLGWRQRAVAFWQRAVELAKKADHPTREDHELLARTPLKIQAVQAGGEAEPAPLGEPVPKTGRPAKPGT